MEITSQNVSVEKKMGESLRYRGQEPSARSPMVQAVSPCGEDIFTGIRANLTPPVRISIDQGQFPTPSESINRKSPPFQSSFEAPYRAPLIDLKDIRRQAFLGFPFVAVSFSGVLG